MSLEDHTNSDLHGLPNVSTEDVHESGADESIPPPERPKNIVDEKPKILLMGLRRSGKSSIQKVVFNKMAPNETLFLESTHKIEKSDVSDCSFIKFQIWDFPGHIDFCESIFQQEAIFWASCAIIFVIDAQDDYHEALNRLHNTVETAFRQNLGIKFDVFIHKVDCLNDEQKIDIQRDITQLVMGAIEEFYCDDNTTDFSIGFHLTTIYDHSIFEAFSKVVQRLIPCLTAFEELLDIFITNSLVDKAFLFDVASKIYLATDSSVVDMQTYELCCDMIDVVMDVASIYTPRSDLVDPPFSSQTACTVLLDTDTVLYLRGVNQYMALACLMHEESLEKMGLIEYNFQVIRDGLQQLLLVNQQYAQTEHATLVARIRERRLQLKENEEAKEEGDHGDDD